MSKNIYYNLTTNCLFNHQIVSVSWINTHSSLFKDKYWTSGRSMGVVHTFSICKNIFFPLSLKEMTVYTICIDCADSLPFNYTFKVFFFNISQEKPWPGCHFHQKSTCLLLYNWFNWRKFDRRHIQIMQLKKNWFNWHLHVLMQQVTSESTAIGQYSQVQQLESVGTEFCSSSGLWRVGWRTLYRWPILDVSLKKNTRWLANITERSLIIIVKNLQDFIIN